MSSVFKKTYTTAIPKGTQIVIRDGKPVAAFRDRTGRLRYAPINDKGKMKRQTEVYYGSYRDENGICRVVSTGQTTKDAARTFLANLEQDVLGLRLGRITRSEIRARDMRGLPVAEHLAAYIADLRKRQIHPARIQYSERRLREVMDACRFGVVGDLDGHAAVEWLREQKLSANLYNEYVGILAAFGYWLAGKRTVGKRSNFLGPKVVVVNPFANLGKKDTSESRQRVARALSVKEAETLLAVAKMRPVAEYGRKGVPVEGKKRSNWQLEPLTPQTLHEAYRVGSSKLSEMAHARLMTKGQERYLIYKMAMTTGLRRGEIARLTINQFHLNDSPFVELSARQTKNRKVAKVELSDELARELRDWFDGRAQSDKAFKTVPRMTAINADLAAAGIEKRTELGVVHFHAMRHTFGTWLIGSGVPLAVATKAMRHSDSRLLETIYCDPNQLGLREAVDSLPIR